MSPRLAPVLFAAVALGCWGEQPSQIATTEPLIVHAVSGDPAAQFIRGKLPGKAPPPKGTAPAPSSTADGGVAPAGPPLVIEFTLPNTFVAGQAGLLVTGTTSPNGYSVGLALKGSGSGYWVVPVQAPDPQTGNPVWRVTADFSADVKPGLRDLLAVAFDENGTPGQQSAKTICVGSPVPDNFNDCRADGKKVPYPNAVITLSWDTPVDLDLQVKPPDADLVEPKHPVLGASGDGGPPATDAPAIDHDALANCVLAGAYRESLIFPATAPKPEGRYGIYVNLFDNCKQPVVHFTVEVYVAVPSADGGVGTFERKLSRSGELIDIQANGGSARGLFVADYNFK